ncbi:MAG: hypothetical protein FJZ00_08830 [Candidatus Sericytochromatia bacterium]|uniref:Uncharacterized protein n=1 Tax=Candidatus Tanganyikabacteria bacterium TaxID=2961651 RepID=A0A937X6I1_9BACT|nr:hypothetical protein [Candidatus Tanganyikabacteria bacterium]
MVSDVPYRRRMDTAVAYRAIETQSGKSWAPEVVAAFKRCIAPYPVNTLVRLNTGEAALVTAVDPDNPFKPRVRVGACEIALSADPSRRIAGSLVRRYFYRELLGMPIKIRLERSGTFFPARL